MATGQGTPAPRPGSWVSVRFALGHLGVGRKKLYAEVKAGNIEHRRTVGGRGGRGELRFKVSWLDAWLERKEKADG